eukprot:c2920_g1_i1.p1 GENE.c2920_g1_i1~~c2920_g1_i1.p1  ORF type:complete len:574 (+),score=112.74 c2920_g1_i1:59-1723(+)
MRSCIVVLGLVVSLFSGANARMEHAQALLEQPAQEQGSQSTTDEAVVTRAFGSTAVNMENLKTFIRARGVSDIGLIDDLIVRAACIVRLENGFGGQLTTAGLQEYLKNRELSTAGSKDEIFDRSCSYQSKENQVVELLGKPVADVTKEELKAQLATLGFVSTTGSKSQLVERLGQAYKDILTIRKLLNDKTFDSTKVKPLLEARGLSTEGNTNILLSRLADYLVNAAQNTIMPGVSSHCDMVVESAICISGGEKVLTSDALPRGLVGKWTFDDQYMLDHSGKSHHAKEAVGFGPGFNGFGQSAKFDGNNMLEIPNSEALSNSDFCVSLWLYLLADSTGQWRTIIHKGSRDNERTPTLFLEPQTRGIEFFVSTTDDAQPAGERVWSNTFVPLRKWTHVVGCAEGRNLRLYINGILDAENTTIGTPMMNQGPLYVGNDPWRPAGGIAGFVDELRYYSRSLTVDEIQAEAQSALGLVEPSFVELGCMGCSLDNCPKTCRKGFRMCSNRDLLSGGYFVARSMGWASTETRIWAAEDGKTTSPGQPLTGLCMCCRIAQD